jgi:hypothetical protein
LYAAGLDGGLYAAGLDGGLYTVGAFFGGLYVSIGEGL